MQFCHRWLWLSANEAGSYENMATSLFTFKVKWYLRKWLCDTKRKDAQGFPHIKPMDFAASGPVVIK